MTAAFGEPIWTSRQRPAAYDSPLDDGGGVDLLVVGAGILGLSTALHAARNGFAVRVVEAGEIGGGASGLNGGQVIPGLKYDPDG